MPLTGYRALVCGASKGIGRASAERLAQLGASVTVLARTESVLAEVGDYYTVSTQSFPAVAGTVFESRLVIGHEVPSSALPMGLTPPTKHKEPVFGKFALVDNDGCDDSDYPESVSGAIALIPLPHQPRKLRGLRQPLAAYATA